MEGPMSYRVGVSASAAPWWEPAQASPAATLREALGDYAAKLDISDDGARIMVRMAAVDEAEAIVRLKLAGVRSNFSGQRTIYELGTTEVAISPYRVGRP